MNADFDIIYFDMDSVLADFEKGVRELCGMEPSTQDSPDRDERDGIMFERISRIPNFYLKLDPIQGTLDILKELRSRYGGRIEILTGVPKPHRNVPTAASDKMLWVRKYIGDGITVHTVLRREKMEYAKGPGSILIDDLRMNIDEWTAAGGTGILFTCPDDLRMKLSEMGIL